MTLFDQYQNKTISTFQPGDRVQNYFKIVSVQKKVKKNGEPYLTLEVVDQSGRIGAKIWENLDSFLPMVQVGSICRISGSITEFQNQKEIKIEVMKPVNPEQNGINPDDFEEKPAFDVEQRFDDMISTLKKHIHNSFLLELVDIFVRRHRKEFQDHFGAQKIHHAYPGGLLEHTHAVMKLAVMVGTFYRLDLELLLIGALFHDIGKLAEYTRRPGVETTIQGGLIGHIILGDRIFIEMKNQIKGFPDDLSLKIQHLIIAHHGEREFGSPEVPKTPEAFVLHLVDMMDSKINIFRETLKKSVDRDSFSEYNRLLNRRIYIPGKSDGE